MVDDGSTDASAAIAAEFARRDPRFRARCARRTAASAARATPASTPPTGEFLAFVDSDDVAAAERVRAAARRARRDRLGLRDRQRPPARRARTPRRRRSWPGPSRRPGWAPTSRASGRCSPTARPGTSCGGGRSGTRTRSGSPRASCTRTSRSSLPAHFMARVGRRDRGAGVPVARARRRRPLDHAAAARAPGAARPARGDRARARLPGAARSPRRAALVRRAARRRRPAAAPSRARRGGRGVSRAVPGPRQPAARRAPIAASTTR